jgi:hypothetical protein
MMQREFTEYYPAVSADGKGIIMIDIDIRYALICPADARWIFVDWKEAETRRRRAF